MLKASTMYFSNKSFACFLASSLATSLLLGSALADDRRLSPAELDITIPIDDISKIIGERARTDFILPDADSSRIIGGEDAIPGDYPYFASMLVIADNHSCGGSLIHPNIILTAAHCPEPYAIRIGNSDISGTDTLIPKPCVQFVEHPGWDPTTIQNDYALCYLPVDVLINDDDVKLEISFDNSFLDHGDMLRTIGLGLTAYPVVNNSPELPDTLQFLDLPYVDFDTCSEYYGPPNWPPPNSPDVFVDEETMLCAGFQEGGKASCFGDSGGPIFDVNTNRDNSETHTIVGVVSWGNPCALPNFPTVYASTSGGAQWIKETVCDTWGVGASFCPKVGKATKATKAAKAPGARRKMKAAKYQNCDVGVRIEIVTDFFDDQSSFYLKNDDTGEIVSQVSDLTIPSNRQINLNALCSGESYTAVLEDSYHDGQFYCDPSSFDDFPPFLQGRFGVTPIFEQSDPWDGDFIIFGLFLPSPNDDCNLEIDVDIFTDFFPEETSWILFDATDTSNLIFVDGMAPGTYTTPLELYTETISGLCPDTNYVFVLLDSDGDGQVSIDNNLSHSPNVPWSPFLKPDSSCPIPGMIGTLMSNDEVIFDKLGYWAGESLQATFVAP